LKKPVILKDAPPPLKATMGVAHLSITGKLVAKKGCFGFFAAKLNASALWISRTASHHGQLAKMF
jgi:hypothetical protein